MGAKTQLKVKVRGCQVFTEDCALMMPVRYDTYDYAVYELEVGNRYFISCLSGVEEVLATEKGIITLEERPRGYMRFYCEGANSH
jgi:hypothetical protein